MEQMSRIAAHKIVIGILDGNVKAVCTDGKITLSPENVSPCKETSK